MRDALPDSAGHLGACTRLAALCLATAGFFALWVTGRLVITFSSPCRAAGWRALVFRAWARVAACVMGMRIESRGEPPRAPYLLVANHLGYVDVVALAALTGCVFVAKSEVAGWPVLGPTARALGTIFIDRRRARSIPAALARVGGELERGAGVVIFAEGTSTRGSVVAPFKPSLLEAAARAGAPVHYAALSYRTRHGRAAASERVCWWGDMTFLDHFYALLRLGGFDAEVRFGEQPITERDRKLLAQKLRAAVEAEFVPVV